MLYCLPQVLSAGYYDAYYKRAQQALQLLLPLLRLLPRPLLLSLRLPVAASGCSASLRMASVELLRS